MIRIKFTVLIPIFLLFIGQKALSQSPFKFGDIPMNDLTMKEYVLDKDADAVYLFDWAEAKLNPFANKAITVKKHFRIKILKPQGLSQATIKIGYDATKIPDLKACAYNLVDGKTESTPLNKKDIFVEKNFTDSYTIGFALTNVKVGSIIECSYTLNYNSIFQFYPWFFQHKIPVAYSEYEAIYPAVFQYKYELKTNNLPIKLETQSQKFILEGINTSLITQKYTGSNLPAFEPEPLMGPIAEVLARVEFELGRIEIQGYRKNITPTYDALGKELMEDSNFGIPINSNSPGITKLTQKIIKGVDSDVDKIKAIHHYISENIKLDEDDVIYLTHSRLKKVIELQTGSAAEINLLLVTMLKKAGLSAFPVVLSTKENGKLNPFLASRLKLNYVLAYVKTDHNEYLVDATDDKRPFNILPINCLNGFGRVIYDLHTDWVALSNKEQKSDQYIIELKIDDNQHFAGSIQRIYSSYSGYNERKLLQNVGKEGYLELLKQEHGSWEYSNFRIENLDSINRPLVVKFDFNTNEGIQKSNDLYLLNPVVFFAQKENKFSATERKFPIEFECPEEENYTLNLQIPTGYLIDEIPAPTGFKLKDDAGFFTYKVDKTDQLLSIMYRYKLKQTSFETDYYPIIREFFNKMLKKQSELIILKSKTPILTLNK